MSTAPATAPYVWDSSNTNTSTPTSGHLANGYANNEVPTAREWNGLWANWSAWLAWLSGATLSTEVKVISLAGFSPVLGSPVLVASGSNCYVSDPSNSFTVGIPIQIENGWTLTDVEFCFSSASSHEGGAVLASVTEVGTTSTLALLGENSPTTGTRTYSLATTYAGTTQTLLTPFGPTTGTRSIVLLAGPFGAGDHLLGVKVSKTR